MIIVKTEFCNADAPVFVPAPIFINFIPEKT